MQFKNLLVSVLSSYHERYSKWPTKTRLLKLTYLVDLFHKRRFGKRLITNTWIYYLYGPYITDYDSVLSETDFKVDEVEVEDEKNVCIISLSPDIKLGSYSSDIKTIIYNVVSDFGDRSFVDLLDYIYFDTEPMINATERKKPLDFDTVKSEKYYRVRKLSIDDKVERELRQNFRKRLKGVQNGKGTS